MTLKGNDPMSIDKIAKMMRLQTIVISAPE